MSTPGVRGGISKSKRINSIVQTGSGNAAVAGTGTAISAGGAGNAAVVGGGTAITVGRGIGMMTNTGGVTHMNFTDAGFDIRHEPASMGTPSKVPGSSGGVEVYVDGKLVATVKKDVRVGGTGAAEVIVKGSCTNVDVKSGNVTVSGKVDGNVSVAVGHVTCKDVAGDVTVATGNINKN